MFRPFVPSTFCPFDLLSHWYFLISTFCPFNLSSIRPFVPSTFCPSTFCPSTFCPSTFCPSTFCPSTFCPSTFCPSTFRLSTFCHRSNLPNGIYVKRKSEEAMLHVLTSNSDDLMFHDVSGKETGV